jgi:hypothetical protein
MQFDRRAFLATLATAVAISAMPSEALADALEHHMIENLDHDRKPRRGDVLLLMFTYAFLLRQKRRSEIFVFLPRIETLQLIFIPCPHVDIRERKNARTMQDLYRRRHHPSMLF